MDTRAESKATVADSQDNCIECGHQISSQRQIAEPGCAFCQSCADALNSDQS